MTTSEIFRAVTGPTGVGKTAFALELLEESPQTSLINADAYQFYVEIPILSNQQSFPKNLSRRFFADRSISQPNSAGEFSKEAKPHLEEKALWVGTGLYLCATLYGLDGDGRKGTPFQGEALRDYRMIVLTEERAALYRRLDERVDQMLKEGAVEEARRVFESLKNGLLPAATPPLKAIGLRHLLLHFQNELSWEECLRLWKRDSRRLAKRQFTWLKKFCAPSERVLWVDRAFAFENIKKLRTFLDL